MSILFVSGVNDLSTIGVTLDDKGQPVYLMNGNASVHHRLPLKEGVAASLLIFGKGVKQHGVQFKKPPSLIFNQIADPDTHRGALERCVELCDQVNTTVINHPGKVLETSRDRVSQALQGIPGVIVPRTQRFKPRSPQDVFSRATAEGFKFPLIVRVAGLHGGRDMIRVDGVDALDDLHALPFDGRDFYLTQFVDSRSDDGYYRKTRVAVIDGVPLIRHYLIDRNWIVNASSLAFMDQSETLTDEARQMMAEFHAKQRPLLSERVLEIATRLGLEYFGIDFHLNERGEMLVFEANANMNILYNSRREYDECLSAIRQHLLRMLEGRSGETVRDNV